MSRLPRNVASSAARSLSAELRFALTVIAAAARAAKAIAPFWIPENQTLEILLTDGDTGATLWDSGIAISDETEEWPPVRAAGDGPLGAKAVPLADDIDQVEVPGKRIREYTPLTM